MTVAQWIALHVRVWGRFPTLPDTREHFPNAKPSYVSRVWKRMEAKQKAGKNV